MKLTPIVGLLALLAATAQADTTSASKTPRTIFVIAFENHNFTQSYSLWGIDPIKDNEAAPYINSLVTPGNPNAAQVSYATAYYNAGVHVHPSESNYIWAEAGTNFNVHTDADPSKDKGNLFSGVEHLTGQLDKAGISWKNYQEDVQLSGSPTKSAVGRDGPVNPYNGSTQYHYAVKHNPMAFFTDTATRNVYPLAQLWKDLKQDSVGRYNWITPDQFNDAHSHLKDGFDYHGKHYTGDQSSIAEADNFLSQVVPRIMATDAYKNNGVIIIWWDESEKGDDTDHTIPEIVISRLARGNAYASSVPMNHSSDLKTMEEIFQLPFVDNPIPKNEPAIGIEGYSRVKDVNDLSDLFQEGVIPQAH